MRDLMALTAQPHVISLAGGLPDVSAFPAELLAKITAQMAAEASVRALQYGPTEGIDDVRAAIVEVMAAENIRHLEIDDILVTSGGQQAIDLVCRTLVDPGDVVIAEAPTYPGAVPCFGSFEADVVQIAMDADGMRIDELEQTLERLKGEGRRPEVHLHRADLPQPGRRDDVAAAPQAPGRGRARARAARSSRTTPTGCCATRASRCRRCTSWTAATSSSTWARSPRSWPPGCASAGRSRRARSSRR